MHETNVEATGQRLLSSAVPTSCGTTGSVIEVGNCRFLVSTCGSELFTFEPSSWVWELVATG
jgi:hypothetical protein